MTIKKEVVEVMKLFRKSGFIKDVSLAKKVAKLLVKEGKYKFLTLLEEHGYTVEFDDEYILTIVTLPNNKEFVSVHFFNLSELKNLKLIKKDFR